MTRSAAEEQARGLAAYRRVLGAPGVAPLASATMLSQLQAGMCPVALVLFVHHATGSFAAAGVVAGSFTIGLGGTGPLLARLVDRVGVRQVLAPASLVAAAALVGLVVLGENGVPPAALAAAAALAGSASPPVGSVMRRLYPELVAAADLPTAYAVDALQLETIFIAGPLLAGGLAAAAGTAEGVLAAAVVGAVGNACVVILHSRRGEQWPRERSSPGWAGALAVPAVRALALSGLPLGATFGALDVALPAFGTAHGAAALGGVLAASIGVGSALGGLLYGAHPHRLGPPVRAYVNLSGAMALACLPLLAATTIAKMFACVALAGVCLTPLVISRNRIIQEGTPPGIVVEAFTWMGLSVMVGSSAGSAFAGPLVSAAGWRVGVLAACACPVFAYLVVLGCRARLEPAPGVTESEG